MMFSYADALRGDEKRAYHAMSGAFDSLARSVRVPRLPRDRLNEIYTMVKYDDPTLFYLSSPSFCLDPRAGHCELIPTYTFPVREIPAMRTALDTRMRRILSGAETLSEPEKVRFVWRFLTETVTYERAKRKYSHEIYGVLSHGIGVCEGIAKTFKALLDRLSVPSVVVLGDLNEEGTRHAWNLIRLYGTWRHYDATFDLDRVKEGKKPRYFGVADDSIYSDHEPSVFPIPAAPDR